MAIITQIKNPANDALYDIAHAGQGSGVCTSESGSALTVSLNGYKNVPTGFIAVKFNIDVSENSTLNVNSTGDIPIYYNGSAITANVLKAGTTAIFLYDGTNYNLVSYTLDLVPGSGTKALQVDGNTASGNYSFAEGGSTTASGNYSHAEGRYTQATNQQEHAEGVYNKSNTKSDGTADENKAGTTQSSIGIGTSSNDRKNAVEVMQNGDVYVTGIGGYNGTNPNESNTLQTLINWDSNAESITYASLKILRDGGNLVPGKWYRITDYITTTIQADTQSAGHQFDIIVVADSTNKLNENAYAAHHEGDTYFADSKLESWGLKYCLDNDTNRFAWADSDIPAYIVVMDSNCYRDSSNDMVYEESNYYAWTDGLYNMFYTKSETPSTDDYVYYYDSDMMYDVGLISGYQPAQIGNGKGVIYYMKDEFGNECHYDFKNIQFKFTSAISTSGIVANVYYYTFSVATGTNDATVTDHSLHGKFCYGNKIGQYISQLSGEFTTHIKQRLPFNVFRNTHSQQVCYSNIFENRCYSNTFGNSCYSNTFGDQCYSNSFANDCRYNTLGNDCYSNTFRNGCYYNTFGNNCYSNTFGTYCRNNTFGTSCNHIIFSKNYTQNCIVESGNQFITLTSTHSTNLSNLLRNITISQGVNNTISNINISHDTVNDEFQTMYAKDASGNLKSWVSADIVKNSGDTMTGALILHDHPTASSPAKQAATKGYIDDAITALPSPMLFKGTATITLRGTTYTVTVSDPATASDIKEGYTYKITSVPADDTNFKSGDTLIANIDNPGNNPETNWSLIPSGDDVEDTWRPIKVNNDTKLQAGISTGDVDFNSSTDINAVWDGTNSRITYTHSNSITAGTAGSSSAHSQTGTEGGNVTFNVPYITYNGKGHITAAGTHTETITLPTHADMIYVTWSELVYMRTNDQLSPGQWYIIQDYTTTTNPSLTNIRSAGHSFHVIVRADAIDELNENAYSDYCNGWQLKYCLDNDTNRFSWADNTSGNGKGVIYWMKDEFGNECPYDFKNIQFKRNLLAVDANNKPVLTNLAGWYGSDWMAEESYIPACNTAYDDFKNSTTHSLFWSLGNVGVIEVGSGDYDDLDDYLKQEAGYQDGDLYIILSENNNVGPQLVAKVTSTERYFYTFTSESGIASNHSISQDSIADNSLSASNEVYNNKFESTLYGTWNLLNNILFGNYCHNNTFGGTCNSNTFDNNCYNNSFGNDCYNNTFGTNCRNNIFGNSCNGNTFGNNCTSNTFGNECTSNTFGNYFQYNTFGNGCSYNTFGTTCRNNTFGNSCNSNTFGNSCNSNTFGNDCYSNIFETNCQNSTFGNSCLDNTFGNNCYYNTFGGSCYSNKFGNSCYSNTFENSCYNITFSKDYTYYCVVENGNHHITLTSTQPTSSSNLLRNITISQGVNNTTATKTIYHNTVNDTFQTVYGIDSSGTLVAWNDADGANMLSKIKSVTYSELVSLRNNSQLIAGQQYRITDYVTTTAQTNTQSAGHRFDVIVRADSTGKLNENAYATRNVNETSYFSSSKLESWELKYCLDNDTTRFSWAKNDNSGRGVIYYMKDEFGNECPYDFKNIQFRFTSAISQPGIVANVYYYTFSVATGTSDATVTDHSLNGGYCYGNKICGYTDGNKLTLSFNVFRNTTETSPCYSNTLGSDCYNNTFGNSFYNNRFGNSCYGNKFGSDSYTNTFKNGCNNNVFGNYFIDNIFGNSCYSNTFGTNCSSNTIGNNYYSNTHGNYFTNNIIYNYCYSNSFGNNCQYNSFGNNCYNNTFGTDSSNNGFENTCFNNTLGGYCSSNTFGGKCNHITFSKDYTQQVIIENGNQYISVTSTETTAAAKILRNITISQGVNELTTVKNISHDTVNDIFKTTYQPANSQVISV